MEKIAQEIIIIIYSLHNSMKYAYILFFFGYEYCNIFEHDALIREQSADLTGMLVSEVVMNGDYVVYRDAIVFQNWI